ncbi:MAG: hypothetical protein M3440_10760, partial [Chloroflexota bacterium]|nr:hypothetical protein [Chloroflexota bacterium]
QVGVTGVGPLHHPPSVTTAVGPLESGGVTSRGTTAHSRDHLLIRVLHANPEAADDPAARAVRRCGSNPW